VALERSTTARQAIKMMGDLATELGFYAADWVGGDASKGEFDYSFGAQHHRAVADEVHILLTLFLCFLCHRRGR
jgi:hypothetical protein